MNIDVENLLGLIKSFYTLSGIKVAIYDENFKGLITYPIENGEFCEYLAGNSEIVKKCADCTTVHCQKCAGQKDTIIYKCHAGLTEVVSPIIENGVVVGAVVFGQITNEPDRKVFEQIVLENCRKYNLDENVIKDKLVDVKYYSDDQLRATADIVKALTSYIILNKMVYIKEKNLSLQIIDYICENLSGDLSVPSLCRHFAISKSKLYNSVSEHMPEGIAAYVKKCRLELAKEKILKHTEEPIWKICEESGFDNYEYFLRAFKGYYGVSPSRLKKANRNVDDQYIDKI